MFSSQRVADPAKSRWCSIEEEKLHKKHFANSAFIQIQIEFFNFSLKLEEKQACLEMYPGRRILLPLRSTFPPQRVPRSME